MPGTWPTISRSSRPSICPSIDPSSTPSFTSSRPLPPTRSTRSSPSATFSSAIVSKPQPENPLSGFRSPEQLGEGLSPFCLIHAPGRQVGKQVDLGGAQICIERAVIRKAVRRSLGFDNRPDRGVAGKQLSPSGDESKIIPDHRHLARRRNAEPLVRQYCQPLRENCGGHIAPIAARAPKSLQERWEGGLLEDLVVSIHRMPLGRAAAVGHVAFGLARSPRSIRLITEQRWNAVVNDKSRVGQKPTMLARDTVCRRLYRH